MSEAHGKIDRLIINSPFVEPSFHWTYEKIGQVLTWEIEAC